MTARRVIVVPRPRPAPSDAKRADAKRTSGSQSLERGLDILEMIAAEGSDVGVRELARRSALSPTIVQRLISSLAARGYIEKNSETARYRLGHRSLAASLAKVRRQGFAIVNEENIPGVLSVGAPIRDRTGSVVAALSVAFPKYLAAGLTLPSVEPLVTDAAQRISRLLGTPPAMLFTGIRGA